MQEKSLKTFPGAFRYVGSVAREENISGSRPLGVQNSGSDDIVGHVHRVRRNSIGCPAGKRWKLLTVALDRRRVDQKEQDHKVAQCWTTPFTRKRTGTFGVG